jgi:hypothetical protein
MIKKIITSASLGWLYVMPLQADTLELDYGSLYSHTRKLDPETMPALQFAFGFMHQQQQRLCVIKKVFIHTQKQDIALEVTAENRFTVPSERALKLARAVVNVELDDMADDCDMSVQLETTNEYLKTQYYPEELKVLQRQYAEFFDQMGSFMSFLMPEVKGLIIHFEQQPTGQVRTDGDLPVPEIIDQQMRLSNDWLDRQKRAGLHLPAKPGRIVAWVE